MSLINSISECNVFFNLMYNLNFKIMKVYMVIEKMYYTYKGVEYQLADALQPITVFSSYKKANEAFEDYKKWFEKHGYKADTEFRNQFPVEHLTFKRESDGNRKVLYILESEVE